MHWYFIESKKIRIHSSLPFSYDDWILDEKCYISNEQSDVSNQQSDILNEQSDGVIHHSNRAIL
jgi:hypothetical protein